MGFPAETTLTVNPSYIPYMRHHNPLLIIDRSENWGKKYAHRGLLWCTYSMFIQSFKLFLNLSSRLHNLYLYTTAEIEFISLFFFPVVTGDPEAKSVSWWSANF